MLNNLYLIAPFVIMDIHEFPYVFNLQIFIYTLLTESVNHMLWGSLKHCLYDCLK